MPTGETAGPDLTFPDGYWDGHPLMSRVEEARTLDPITTEQLRQAEDCYFQGELSEEEMSIVRQRWQQSH